MNDLQIANLRDAVESARTSRQIVMWQDIDGRTLQVLSVPLHPADPDDTGITDRIAILEKGHIDLANTDADTFYLAKPLDL